MSKLYVVATPIGNLGDVTFRAVEILKFVDLILCEDTRVTKRLLDHYDIDAHTMSYHANSKLSKTEKILELLEQGRNLALVSDAGTPTISDPGVQLIQKINESAIAGDIEIIAIPGPSAITAALSVAGVSGNEFTFLGFLPHKKGRQTIFNEITDATRAMVFYESPHRIEKTLVSLTECLDDNREVIVCRELTKIYEQIMRGTATQVCTYFQEHPDKVRGEFVVIVNNL